MFNIKVNLDDTALNQLSKNIVHLQETVTAAGLSAKQASRPNDASGVAAVKSYNAVVKPVDTSTPQNMEKAVNQLYSQLLSTVKLEQGFAKAGGQTGATMQYVNDGIRQLFTELRPFLNFDRAIKQPTTASSQALAKFADRPAQLNSEQSVMQFNSSVKDLRAAFLKQSTAMMAAMPNGTVVKPVDFLGSGVIKTEVTKLPSMPGQADQSLPVTTKTAKVTTKAQHAQNSADRQREEDERNSKDETFQKAEAARRANKPTLAPKKFVELESDKERGYKMVSDAELARRTKNFKDTEKAKELAFTQAMKAVLDATVPQSQRTNQVYRDFQKDAGELGKFDDIQVNEYGLRDGLIQAPDYKKNDGEIRQALKAMNTQMDGMVAANRERDENDKGETLFNLDIAATKKMDFKGEGRNRPVNKKTDTAIVFNRVMSAMEKLVPHAFDADVSPSEDKVFKKDFQSTLAQELSLRTGVNKNIQPQNYKEASGALSKLLADRFGAENDKMIGYYELLVQSILNQGINDKKTGIQKGRKQIVEPINPNVKILGRDETMLDIDNRLATQRRLPKRLSRPGTIAANEISEEQKAQSIAIANQREEAQKVENAERLTERTAAAAYNERRRLLLTQRESAKARRAAGAAQKLKENAAPTEDELAEDQVKADRQAKRLSNAGKKVQATKFYKPSTAGDFDYSEVQDNYTRYDQRGRVDGKYDKEFGDDTLGADQINVSAFVGRRKRMDVLTAKQMAEMSPEVLAVRAKKIQVYNAALDVYELAMAENNRRAAEILAYDKAIKVPENFRTDLQKLATSKKRPVMQPMAPKPRNPYQVSKAVDMYQVSDYDTDRYLGTNDKGERKEIKQQIEESRDIYYKRPKKELDAIDAEKAPAESIVSSFKMLKETVAVEVEKVADGLEKAAEKVQSNEELFEMFTGAKASDFTREVKKAPVAEMVTPAVSYDASTAPPPLGLPSDKDIYPLIAAIKELTAASSLLRKAILESCATSKHYDKSGISSSHLQPQVTSSSFGFKMGGSDNAPVNLGQLAINQANMIAGAIRATANNDDDDNATPKRQMGFEAVNPHVQPSSTPDPVQPAKEEKTTTVEEFDKIVDAIEEIAKSSKEEKKEPKPTESGLYPTASTPKIIPPVTGAAPNPKATDEPGTAGGWTTKQDKLNWLNKSLSIALKTMESLGTVTGDEISRLKAKGLSLGVNNFSAKVDAAMSAAYRKFQEQGILLENEVAAITGKGSSASLNKKFISSLSAVKRSMSTLGSVDEIGAEVQAAIEFGTQAGLTIAKVNQLVTKAVAAGSDVFNGVKSVKTEQAVKVVDPRAKLAQLVKAAQNNTKTTGRVDIAALAEIADIADSIGLVGFVARTRNSLIKIKKKFNDETAAAAREVGRIDQAGGTAQDQGSFKSALSKAKGLAATFGDSFDLGAIEAEVRGLGGKIKLDPDLISRYLETAIREGLSSYNAKIIDPQAVEDAGIEEAVKKELENLKLKVQAALNLSGDQALAQFENLPKPKVGSADNQDTKFYQSLNTDQQDKLAGVVVAYEKWQDQQVRAAQGFAYNAARDLKRSTNDQTGLQKIAEVAPGAGRLDLANKAKGEMNRIFGEQFRQSMQEVYYLSSNVQNLFKTIGNVIQEIAKTAGRQEKENLRSDVANVGNTLASDRDRQSAADQSKRLGGAAIDVQSDITDFKASNPITYSKGGERLESKYADDFASKMVEALSSATSVNQLTAEESRRLLTSAKQMQSIGTVNAEELKQQMAGVFAGAPAIMAKSLGITTGELLKRQKRNDVASDETLPLFAQAVLRQFGTAAGKETLAKKVRTFEGNVTQLSVKTGEVATIPTGLVVDMGNAALKTLIDSAKLIALGIPVVLTPILLVAMGSMRQIVEQMRASSNTALRVGSNVVNKMAAPVALFAGAAVAGQVSQGLGADSVDVTIDKALKNLGLLFDGLGKQINSTIEWFGKLLGIDPNAKKDKEDNQFTKTIAQISALTAGFAAFGNLAGVSFKTAKDVSNEFKLTDAISSDSVKSSSKFGSVNEQKNKATDVLKDLDVGVEGISTGIKTQTVTSKSRILSAMSTAFSAIGSLAASLGVSALLAVATVVLANTTFKTKSAQSVGEAADRAKARDLAPPVIKTAKEFSVADAQKQFDERGKVDSNPFSLNGIQDFMSSGFKSTKDKSDNVLGSELELAVRKMDSAKDPGYKAEVKKEVDALVQIALKRQGDTQIKTGSGTTGAALLDATDENYRFLNNTESASKSAMALVDSGVKAKATEANAIVTKLAAEYDQAVRNSETDDQLDLRESKLTNAKKKANDAILPFKEAITTIMTGIEELDNQKVVAIAGETTAAGKAAVKSSYDAAINGQKAKLKETREVTGQFDSAEINDKEQSLIKRRQTQMARTESDQAIKSDTAEGAILNRRYGQGDDLTQNKDTAILGIDNAIAREKQAKEKQEIALLASSVARRSGNIEKIEKAASEEYAANTALSSAGKAVAESRMKMVQVLEANTVALFERREAKDANKSSRRSSIITNSGYTGLDNRQGADVDQKVSNQLDKIGYEKLQASYDAYKLIAPKLKLNKEEVTLKLETMRVEADNAKDAAVFAKKKRDTEAIIRKETERILDFGRAENRKDNRLQTTTDSINFGSNSAVLKNKAQELTAIGAQYRIANFEAGRAAEKVRDMVGLIATIKQPEVRTEKLLELEQLQIGLQQKKQAMELAHIERVRAVLQQALENLSGKAQALAGQREADRNFLGNKERNDAGRLAGKTNFYGEASSENAAKLDVQAKRESLKLNMSQANQAVNNGIDTLNEATKRYNAAGVEFDPNKISRTIGQKNIEKAATPTASGVGAIDPASLSKIDEEIKSGFYGATADEKGNRSFKRGSQTVTLNQEEFEQTQAFMQTLITQAKLTSDSVFNLRGAENVYNSVIKKNRAQAIANRKDIDNKRADFKNDSDLSKAEVDTAFKALDREVASSQKTGGANTSVAAIEQIGARAGSDGVRRQTARSNYNREVTEANTEFQRKSENAGAGEIEVARTERDKAIATAEINMNKAIGELSNAGVKDLINATRTARVELKTVRNQYTAFATEIEDILTKGDELLNRYGQGRSYEKLTGKVVDGKYQLDKKGTTVDTTDTNRQETNKVDTEVNAYNENISATLDKLKNANPKALEEVLRTQGRVLGLGDKEVNRLVDSIKDADDNSKEVTEMIDRLSAGLSKQMITPQTLTEMKRLAYDRVDRKGKNMDDDLNIQEIEQSRNKQNQAEKGLFLSPEGDIEDARGRGIYQAKRRQTERNADQAIDDAVDPREKSRLKRKKGLDLSKMDKEEQDTARDGASRFKTDIMDAIAEAGKLSDVIREAMTSGDWGAAFAGYMSKILSNIGDKFLDKAGGAIFSGLGKMFGLSGGSLDTVLPSFAGGTLSGIPSYKEGMSYPKTPTQDPREPYNSRFAVINEREVVLNAEDASLFKKYRNDVRANNVSTKNVTNNTSSTINMNLNTNSFGGNEKVREVRRKKENRFNR